MMPKSNLAATVELRLLTAVEIANGVRGRTALEAVLAPMGSSNLVVTAEQWHASQTTSGVCAKTRENVLWEARSLRLAMDPERKSVTVPLLVHGIVGGRVQFNLSAPRGTTRNKAATVVPAHKVALAT